MIHKIRIIKTFFKKFEFSIGINIANKLEKFIYSLVFLIDATNTVRNKVKKTQMIMLLHLTGLVLC